MKTETVNEFTDQETAQDLPIEETQQAMQDEVDAMEQDDDPEETVQTPVPVDAPPHSQHFFRSFQVTMSQEDRATYADQLSAMVKRLERMKAYHATERKDMKASENNLESAMIEMAEVVNEGTKTLNVACRMYPDLERRVVVTMRLDTGEVIEEKDLTQSQVERYAQGLLPLEESGEPEADDPPATFRCPACDYVMPIAAAEEADTCPNCQQPFPDADDGDGESDGDAEVDEA